MREILFRGQHRRYGEQVNMAEEKLPSVWVYGGVLQGEGDFSIIYGSKSPDGKFEEKYSVYTETLGQYTGLTDKNGTKIFEGDIAECVSWNMFFSDKCGKPMEPFRRKMVVVFRNGAFRMKENLPEPLTPNYWDLIYDGDIAVIGNIHDNPELLKEAT